MEAKLPTVEFPTDQPPIGTITFPSRGVSRWEVWGLVGPDLLVPAIHVLDGMTGIPGFGAMFVTDCEGRGTGVGAANEEKWHPVRDLLLLAIENFKKGRYYCKRCFDTGSVIDFDGIDSTFCPTTGYTGQSFTDITNTSLATCTHDAKTSERLEYVE